MADLAGLNDLIIKSLKMLPDKDKKEVLKFIEFLKIKGNKAFIDYVNDRTRQAIEAKRRGDRFVSLEDLQNNYA